MSSDVEELSDRRLGGGRKLCKVNKFLDMEEGSTLFSFRPGIYWMLCSENLIKVCHALMALIITPCILLIYFV